MSFQINHRKILDGVFGACGVPVDKFRPICSAVDKLDKSPWEDVRKEMVEEKGLDGTIADIIGEYVKLSGREDLLEKLKNDDRLKDSKDAQVHSLMSCTKQMLVCYMPPLSTCMSPCVI